MSVCVCVCVWNDNIKSVQVAVGSEWSGSGQEPKAMSC
jgi:hypothetical protein